MLVENHDSLCAVNISKAFGNINHYVLYIKLLKTKFPIQLLGMVTALFSNCCMCVKLDSVYSGIFQISFGVRHGSVLSPVSFTSMMSASCAL